MFTKTIKKIDYLNRAGYIIYQNKIIAIMKHCNKSSYLKELGECLWMLVYGIISIIAFPYCLIILLYKFIPKIYFKKDDKED